MRRTDELFATYRGLVNSVCRPDHLPHFQITWGMASIAATREEFTARQRAAWLFVAMAHALAQDGQLNEQDVEGYRSAAQNWAFEYDRIGAGHFDSIGA